MIIKCNRKEFDVNEKDRILDNGSCYQLISRRCRSGWNKFVPKMSKTLFNKLKKEGKVRLAKEKYKTTYAIYDLYEFVIDADKQTL